MSSPGLSLGVTARRCPHTSRYGRTHLLSPKCEDAGGELQAQGRTRLAAGTRPSVRARFLLSNPDSCQLCESRCARAPGERSGPGSAGTTHAGSKTLRCQKKQDLPLPVPPQGDHWHEMSQKLMDPKTWCFQHRSPRGLGGLGLTPVAPS